MKHSGKKSAATLIAASGAAGTADTATAPAQTCEVKKVEPLFGADIDIDPRTGKQFELRDGLFIPLPGEFPDQPAAPAPENAPIAVAEKGMWVPRTLGVHFQKDFETKTKMDPMLGVKLKPSKTSEAWASYVVGHEINRKMPR